MRFVRFSVFFCVFLRLCAFLCIFVRFLCVFVRFCAFLCVFVCFVLYFQGHGKLTKYKNSLQIALKIVRVNEAFKTILSDEKESPFSLCFFLTFGGRFQKTFYNCNLGAMTLSITTLSITTLSIMTLSITTLSIMTFSIMGFFATLSINETHHKQHSA